MISVTGTKETFTGDGSTKAFSYTKPFLVKADIIVKTRVIATGVEALYVLDTDYSITATNNDYSSGATITTLAGAALAATMQLVIERKVPTTQITDYPEASFFPAKSTEDALDKLTLLVQQLERRIEECLRVSDTDLLPSRLANSVDRANKYLTFDATGQPVASVIVTGESPPSSLNPKITSGAGVPGSAPGKIGDIYIDTAAKVPYIAINTVASTDFVNVLELIADNTPQLFANLDGNSKAITSLTTVDTSGGYKIGTNLVLNVDNARSSVFVGENAGPVSTGLNNTAIGRDALEANTTGANNTAVGMDCLTTNTTGFQSVGVGTSCLKFATGNSNTAIGFEALLTASTGRFNTAAGTQALNKLTTGEDNVAVGRNALFTCVSSSFNVAIGSFSLKNATTSRNTAVGFFALNFCTSGANNTVLGFQAGDLITTGTKNVIIGYDSGAPSTTGSNQLNIGNVIWGSNCSGIGTSPAGQISIGTNTPATGAILELSSTTKAFLPPRMTTVQRDALGSPVAGMMIYNTSLNTMQFHNGTAWGNI